MYIFLRISLCFFPHESFALYHFGTRGGSIRFGSPTKCQALKEVAGRLEEVPISEDEFNAPAIHMNHGPKKKRGPTFHEILVISNISEVFQVVECCFIDLLRCFIQFSFRSRLLRNQIRAWDSVKRGFTDRNDVAIGPWR